MGRSILPKAPATFIPVLLLVALLTSPTPSYGQGKLIKVIYGPEFSSMKLALPTGSPVELAGGFKGFLVTPKESGEEVPLLVLLHEHGGRGDTFASISRYVKIKSAYILSIQGRFRAVTPEGEKMDGYSWWELGPDSTEQSQHDSLVRESQALDEAIQQFLHSQPTIDPNKVVLIGFAQGSRMAQELAGRFPSHYAGVVLFGGYGELEADWKSSLSQTGTPPSFFISIGDGDKHTPLELAKQLKSDLESLGADVILTYVNKTHQIIASEFDQMNRWLGKLLGYPLVGTAGISS